jgi:hypothetical protein
MSTNNRIKPYDYSRPFTAEVRDMISVIKTTKRAPYLFPLPDRVCSRLWLPTFLPCALWSCCIRILRCPFQCDCDGNEWSEASDDCIKDQLALSGVRALDVKRYDSYSEDALSAIQLIAEEFPAKGEKVRFTKVHYLLMEHVVAPIVDDYCEKAESMSMVPARVRRLLAASEQSVQVTLDYIADVKAGKEAVSLRGMLKWSKARQEAAQVAEAAPAAPATPAPPAPPAPPASPAP